MLIAAGAGQGRRVHDRECSVSGRPCAPEVGQALEQLARGPALFSSVSDEGDMVASDRLHTSRRGHITELCSARLCNPAEHRVVPPAIANAAELLCREYLQHPVELCLRVGLSPYEAVRVLALLEQRWGGHPGHAARGYPLHEPRLPGVIHRAHARVHGAIASGVGEALGVVAALGRDGDAVLRGARSKVGFAEV
jgi:hypothetical protein